MVSRLREPDETVHGHGTEQRQASAWSWCRNDSLGDFSWFQTEQTRDNLSGGEREYGTNYRQEFRWSSEHRKVLLDEGAAAAHTYY